MSDLEEHTLKYWMVSGSWRGDLDSGLNVGTALSMMSSESWGSIFERKMRLGTLATQLLDDLICNRRVSNGSN